MGQISGIRWIDSTIKKYELSFFLNLQVTHCEWMSVRATVAAVVTLFAAGLMVLTATPLRRIEQPRRTHNRLLHHSYF